MRRTSPPLLDIPKAFDRLTRLPRLQGWLLVGFTICLAGLGQLAMGPGFWFGPIYLAAICLATWCKGLRSGLLVGMACLALALLVGGESLYPYKAEQFIPNLGIRVAAVTFIVVTVSGMRRAFLREWWLARTDPLTGALNRQAFFEIVGETSLASQWTLLLFADLDGLKKINDTEGHAAGDASLKSFAEAVARSIRRDDVVARFGGDEFVVFMHVKDETAGRTTAARLHNTMNRWKCAGLGCSVGVVIVPPSRVPVESLVNQADNLMYQAKMRGAGMELQVLHAPASLAEPSRTSELVRSGDAPFIPRPTHDRERRAQVMRGFHNRT